MESDILVCYPVHGGWWVEHCALPPADLSSSQRVRLHLLNSLASITRSYQVIGLRDPRAGNLALNSSISLCCYYRGKGDKSVRWPILDTSISLCCYHRGKEDTSVGWTSEGSDTPSVPWVQAGTVGDVNVRVWCNEMVISQTNTCKVSAVRQS